MTSQSPQVGTPSPSHRRQGVRIKIALIEQGLVQREAAAALDMVLSTFNMKLRGERDFTDDEKKRLSAILGKPEEWLFSDDAPQHHPANQGETENEHLRARSESGR